MSFWTIFCLCDPPSLIIWRMVPEIWRMTDRIFCHFGPFLPFYLSNNTKNLNFEKLKKTPGDIIILHKYNKSNKHMLYCSLDIVGNRCHFYFLFWAIFCHFTSKTASKIKIKKKKKKWKKCQEISLFYNSVPKIIFHLGPFFALLPP